MAKIKVIIPNAGMDRATLDERERMLSQAVSAETMVSVDCIDGGPPSVESTIDEVIVAPKVLAQAVEAEQSGFQAVVIYCFSDPGLGAVREAVRVPVIGPGETSLAVASLLGHRITVLTTLASGIPRMTRRCHHSGFDPSRLASVRGLNLPVVDLREDARRTITGVAEAVRLAVEEDGAEVIVMGCLGLAGYGQEAEQSFGVPVVDPAFVALSTAEMFVRLGLGHSRRTFFPNSLPDFQTG